MSRQIRTRLARGVKLLVEHVSGPLVSADIDLNTPASLISRDQRSDQFGLFRVHLNIPVIDSQLFPSAVTFGGRVSTEFCVPFVLPPLQEFLSETAAGSRVSDGRFVEGSPAIDLVEVSLGWDQRDEPAAIADTFRTDSTGGGHAGKLDYDGLDAYDLTVSVLQKQMHCFGGEEPYVPDQEVWSGSIPSLSFGQRSVHINPFVWEGIERSIDPYRSCLLAMSVPKLLLEHIAGPPAINKSYALVSVNVQMVFRHRLVPRDSSAAQNLPLHHLGGKTVKPLDVAATVPASNSPVAADGVGGLQSMLKLLDNVFLRKLRGGYRPDCDVPEQEHLQDDAGYEVIALPFFSSMGAERVITSGNVTCLPYIGVTTENACVDRRIIPLSWPMTIHHVVAAVSYAKPMAPVGIQPVAASFLNQIGVNIGRGFPRGDACSYQVVASVDWSPATKAAVTLDRIKVREDGALSGGLWDYELIDVPLVRHPTGGVGLSVAQGLPFFVGRASSLMVGRTPVGTPHFIPAGSQPSLTAGEETFLEVRWSFLRTGGGGLAGMAPDEVIVGYGGHWVFLIGKRHLAAPGGVKT